MAVTPLRSGVQSANISYLNANNTNMTFLPCTLAFADLDSTEIITEKVQVGKDQEKAQSEKR